MQGSKRTTTRSRRRPRKADSAKDQERQYTQRVCNKGPDDRIVPLSPKLHQLVGTQRRLGGVTFWLVYPRRSICLQELKAADEPDRPND